MIPKYSKEGEFGTPYSINEARLVAENQSMDEYHREIMCWLIYEVERLEKEVREQLYEG